MGDDGSPRSSARGLQRRWLCNPPHRTLAHEPRGVQRICAAAGAPGAPIPEVRGLGTGRSGPKINEYTIGRAGAPQFDAGGPQR